MLDLFAGSGAAGLEALSRGAAGATFAENGRNALAALRRNLALAPPGSARLLPLDARRALRQLFDEGHRFDLLFVDPPYERAVTDDDLDRLAAVAGEGASLAVERRAAAAAPPRSADWLLSERRRYGDAELIFFERRPG